MKEDNKKFIDVNVFRQRVFNTLKAKNITIDILHEILNNDVGYKITKNNLGIYMQRTPNTNFLVAICKALGVSSDYLLGISDENALSSVFDYNYDSKRYKKYEYTDYFFYFLKTSSNTSTEIKVAKLSIVYDVFYKVFLNIETDEGYSKEYTGEFILSNSYDIGYITLKGNKIGEIINLSFYDPNINGNVINTELLSGAMLSVSAGDIKRAPVMSKFIISRKEINIANYDALLANLILNCKYIEIDSDNIKSALDSCDFNNELKELMENRLKNAFTENQYYKLEESYIINTLSTDFKLSSKESAKLLHSLRLHSTAKSNFKINHKTDSRLFDFFK